MPCAPPPPRSPIWGFIAVCPDLFWRIQPGIDITDKTEAEWNQAFGYFKIFDQAKGVEDLKATVAATRTHAGQQWQAWGRWATAWAEGWR